MKKMEQGLDPPKVNTNLFMMLCMYRSRALHDAVRRETVSKTSDRVEWLIFKASLTRL